MANPMRLGVTKRRERLSSVLVAPLPSYVDDALVGLSDRWPVRELEPTETLAERALPGTKGLPVVGHSLDYIRMNSRFLDLAGWTAVVNKMINAFGAPIPKGDVDAIARYLAVNYGKPPATP